jgi:hypothetical protein
MPRPVAAARTWVLALLHNFVRRFGYVHISEVERILNDKNEVERKLVHKQQNLEHQLGIRGRLENEITFLRHLELARADNVSGVQAAADRLDRVCSKIIDMARETWPDAYFLLDDGVPLEGSAAAAG